MAVPFFDLKDQYATLREELRAAVDRVLDSQVCIGGPELDAFEAEVGDFLDAPVAVGCSNGSDAIVLALRALGVGPGDEVIVPSFTFFATAGSVRVVGAKPVFVDVEPASFNIDPADVERKLTDRTRAIIPVDLFGQPADLEPIHALACERELGVIEDAAQAIGARHRLGKVGAISQLTTFSFYPTKNLGTCGEAGLVTTVDEALGERLRQLRNHGQSRQYLHDHVGYNARLDAIQAAILRVKLGRLEGWMARRDAHAARYMERLAGAKLILPPVADWTERHVWNQFTIRIAAGGELDRDAVRAALAERGIGSGVYYPLSLHLQPCFADLGGAEGDCPVSEQASREVLALPIFPELETAQIDEVADALLELVGER